MRKAALARAARYAQQGQIDRIEDEGVEPKAIQLVRIAQALSTTVEWLVTGEDQSSEPGGLYTLSPRGVDTPALKTLVEAYEATGEPLSLDELAWLRVMPRGCELADYRGALKIYRTGTAKTHGERAMSLLAAPPVALVPPLSGVQERETVKSLKPRGRKRSK